MRGKPLVSTARSKKGKLHSRQERFLQILPSRERIRGKRE